MARLFTNCFGMGNAALCLRISMSWTRNRGFELALSLLQRAGMATLICMFAFGGAVVGLVAGAMKGQTTETGFCRGAAIGVMSGAIVGIELLEAIIHGNFLSKVALFGSIWNGKAFREWVSPAVLKAYQWQTSIGEGNGYETEEGIYDFVEARGLPRNIIDTLQVVRLFCSGGVGDQMQEEAAERDMVSCPICLQNLVEGEVARILPECEHMFHLQCVDEWLVRNASCPVCRNQLD